MADDIGRSGRFNSDSEMVERELWGIARAHKLTGEPNSGTEEYVAGETMPDGGSLRITADAQQVDAGHRANMHKNELIALKELPLVGCYLAVAAALLWTLHIIATHYVR